MKHTSLRFRIMVVMLALAVIPVAIVTLYASKNTKDSVEDGIISTNSSRMSWSKQYLESELTGMQNLFDSLQSDHQFISSYGDYSFNLQTQNNLFEVLSRNFFQHSWEIDNLSLYRYDDKKMISVDFANSVSTSQVDIGNSNFARMLKGPVYLYFKRENGVVYAYHSINDFDNHALLGGISARINNSVWAEVTSILNPDNDGSVYIMDESGKILSSSSSDYSMIPTEFEQVNLYNSGVQFSRTKDGLYFMQSIDDGLLTVIKKVPVSVVEKSVNGTIMAGLLIGIFAILLAMILSVLISLHITGPLVRLAKTMRQVQIHDFEMAPVQNNDEIGLLEKGYNNMMQRIKQLIDVKYTQEMEVKDAQIRALQSQINPHFLNNTLQLIGGMALSKDARDIYAITNVMSKMMRYSIDADTHMVQLADELDQVQNYIYIQQNRFGDKFNFEIRMDTNELQTTVPKFILQPILENSFEHGLRHKSGPWKIELIVHHRGDRIGIVILDNGVGMDKETLAKVRELLRNAVTAASISNPKTKQGYSGIGLCNIQSRLRLQFGKRYGIRIFSREGCGSMIVLEIPVTERGKVDV